MMVTRKFSYTAEEIDEAIRQVYEEFKVSPLNVDEEEDLPETGVSVGQIAFAETESTLHICISI